MSGKYPLDLTSRQTLPVSIVTGKVHITFANLSAPDMDALLGMLRADYYACCTDLLAARDDPHNGYGDDRGDYQKASADVMTWLHTTFAYALWHSELSEHMVTELNAMLNCEDEDHCLHQWAIDGPDLALARLGIDWQDCPIVNGPGPQEQAQDLHE